LGRASAFGGGMPTPGGTPAITEIYLLTGRLPKS
jgi:hypothetical protein